MSNHPRCVLILAFLVSSLFSLAHADTITFGNVVTQPHGTAALPSDYEGYSWQNFSVFDSTGCTGVKYEYTSTGYCRLTDATGISCLNNLHRPMEWWRREKRSGSPRPFLYRKHLQRKGGNRGQALRLIDQARRVSEAG
jgi:hypothetical protein